MAVDHRDRSSHEARQFERRDSRRECLGRERVAHRIRAALLDAGGLERRVPLARAPGVEADIAALGRWKDERGVQPRRKRSTPSSSRSVQVPNSCRLEASRSVSVDFVAGATVEPWRSRNRSQKASKSISLDGPLERSLGSTVSANQRLASDLLRNPVPFDAKDPDAKFAPIERSL